MSVTINVNGREITAEKGEVLLTSLRRSGIHVPTLCNIDGLAPSGSCRICVVEVEGQRALVPSCAFPIFDGMKVQTNSQRVLQARKAIIELLLADHPDDCFYCERNGNCQLQSLAEQYCVRSRRYAGMKNSYLPDSSGESIIRDANKCIKCGKCVRVCEEIQGVACIDFINRGSHVTVGTAFDQGLNISSCVNCGQCVVACPTGALIGKSHLNRVVNAINNPEMHVVIQHAPAVSISVGEEFGLPIGLDVIGLMHAALRRIGFNSVFDTSFSADLTIMEEGTELVNRIQNGGVLPMFTSCSPGWIKFVETFFPGNIPNLSTCKSPQQMLGAVIKTFYAERKGIDPKKLFSVSVMPCTAKKFEASRPELGRDGYKDIDAVLTTRELAQLIRMFGVDLTSLEPETADTPFGERSTAGKIFGTSGGVMEAAIRSAHYLLTGTELADLTVEAVRGMEGVKEAKLNINGMTVGVAVVNGLGNARKLLESINAGERNDLHFIEVMTCPGGCVNGGGQPYNTSRDRVIARATALYSLDATESLRVSHQNQEVHQLYQEYLGEPNGEKSHHLLHTHYHQREALV
ncbi:MAG: [FeFe] hydrogenase, group A [Planctomycetaceae bacterium]|jgi:NADH-quinone oxidoreductase subunit G/NADP-reducing hydrogenase subunit HndD|nr:[FeFe] hydrogenase, group A [Planctomycetaceae bacterium]